MYQVRPGHHVREGENLLTGQILLQLIVISIVVQGFGQLCRRVGQQWVIGEILAGLALGPSLLGAFWPGLEGQLFPAGALPTLQTLGELGLVLYMFTLGTRLDTKLMLRQSRSAIVTSLSSILLPLIMGALLAFYLYPDFAGPKANPISFILLVGTAMAITAFPVLARLLAEKQMLDSKIGMLALTSAAAGDAVAWCLLALVVGIIKAKSLAAGALTVGFTLLFIGFMFLVIRPVLAYADQRDPSKQVILALSIVLLLLAAYATNTIGIHPVFGAFLMGIILPRGIVVLEQIRSVDQINNVLFLPLFFV